MTRRNKYIVTFFSLFFVVLCFGFYFISDVISSKSDYSSSTIIEIEKNETFESVVNKICDAKICPYRFIVNVFLYYKDNFSKIKYGEFILPNNVSLSEALKLLSRSPNYYYRITVIEGERSDSVVRKINSNPNLSGPLIEHIEEGCLLPDTYYFLKNTTRHDLLTSMQNSQQKYMKKEMVNKSDLCSLYSYDDIIKLASVVEKEASLLDEKKIIAYIYMKRLKIGMRLQSCPTVLYTTNKNRLSIRETKIKTKYNTYQIHGLPFTPICNPGRDSIYAVLHPIESDFLFFHSDGNGGHKFSKTFSAHKSIHRIMKARLKKSALRRLINS